MKMRPVTFLSLFLFASIYSSTPVAAEQSASGTTTSPTEPTAKLNITDGSSANEFENGTMEANQTMSPHDSTTANITGSDAANETNADSQSETSTTASSDNSTETPHSTQGGTSSLLNNTTEAPNGTVVTTALPGRNDSEATTHSSDATTLAPDVDVKNTTEAGNDTATTEEPAPKTEATTEPTTAGPTVKPHLHINSTAKIGETNLLLVAPSAAESLFIELQGKPLEDLTDLWLVVRDAGPSKTASPVKDIIKFRLASSLDNTGRHLLDKSSGLDLGELVTSEAVLVALYHDESQTDALEPAGLLDLLLVSRQGDLDQAIQETFAEVTRFPLTLDYSQLSIQSDKTLSLSRCSEDISNAGFVLAQSSPGQTNVCSLERTHKLDMWLTLHNKPCPNQMPKDFLNAVVAEVITGVNSVQKCGLTRRMLSNINMIKKCEGEKKTRVDIHFLVSAALKSHLAQVVQGYQSFVAGQRRLPLAGDDYTLHNCTQLCTPPLVNPHSAGNSGRNIQLTVGVVLGCVGIFMVILLVVIVYLKKKRRGILQFRMTRLDEEDDDMIGDMDDFVGNQGPTFRNFR